METGGEILILLNINLYRTWLNVYFLSGNNHAQYHENNLFGNKSFVNNSYYYEIDFDPNWKNIYPSKFFSYRWGF